MIASEYIQLAYQYGVGEATAPVDGEENYEILWNVSGPLIESWQNEKGTNWNSLWDRTNLAPLVTATDTFAIPAKIRKISKEEDGIKIVGPNGSTCYFTAVKPNQLWKGGNLCAQVGRTLKFAKPFDAASPLIGGTISTAYYGYAAKLVDANSLISVDQPMWLVFMGAAELARNDYTKQNNAPGLVAQANEVMEAMKFENEEEENPKVSHGGEIGVSGTVR